MNYLINGDDKLHQIVADFVSWDLTDEADALTFPIKMQLFFSSPYYDQVLWFWWMKFKWSTNSISLINNQIGVEDYDDVSWFWNIFASKLCQTNYRHCNLVEVSRAT